MDRISSNYRQNSQPHPGRRPGQGWGGSVQSAQDKRERWAWAVNSRNWAEAGSSGNSWLLQFYSVFQ